MTAGRVAEREMIVPSASLAAVSSVVSRPMIVAIAHIPIIFVALCAIPVWTMAVVRPKTHGELALRLLRELRTWSREAISAAHGGRHS